MIWICYCEATMSKLNIFTKKNFFLPDKREREEEKKVHIMNNYESPKSF